MPKRSSKPKLDEVQSAKRVFDHVIEQSQVSLTVISNPSLLSQVMRAMGQRGGRIGGKRRLVTLSDERRREIASGAARARWARTKAVQAKGRKKRTA